MEIYTDITKVTLMPDDRTAPVTTNPATTPVRPVVIDARGLVHAPGTSPRPITGRSVAGTASRWLPVSSGTTDLFFTDLSFTDLGSTAWGPPL